MVRRWAALFLLVPCLHACDGPGTGPVDPVVLDGDGDGILDDVEIALLRQYRPFWDFDRDETLFPIPVEEWADAGGRIVALNAGASRPYSDLPSLLAAVEALPGGVMHPEGEPIPGPSPCIPGVGCPFGAPVYGEVTPLADVQALVWIQYWVFYGHDEKDLPEGRFAHRGDWEHVCVLASTTALGDAAAPPLEVHFHHHLELTIAATDVEWVACRTGSAECVGERHPRVYVDLGGHGSHPRAGVSVFGPHRGGFLGNGGLLETPIVPIRPHAANALRLDDDVVRIFRGEWGHDDETTVRAGPAGPLVFTDACDHDFLERPTLADWRPACLATTRGAAPR